MAERNVLLKSLKHPFLVRLHYSFQTPEKLYFVLDYVNGGEVSLLLIKKLSVYCFIITSFIQIEAVHVSASLSGVMCLKYVTVREASEYLSLSFSLCTVHGSGPEQSLVSGKRHIIYCHEK